MASDLLIFRMHTDVFEFDANHLVWQSPYVQADRDNSYCGIIDIYNFCRTRSSSTATPTKAT